MRLQKIFLLICLLVIRSLLAMEERSSSKPELSLTYEEEYEEAGQAGVLLELMDGDEVIYTIKVPQLFAQKSSVIRNNLAFQEEEEGTIPKVQFDSSTVSIGQFDALQIYVTENDKQRNIKKTLDELQEQWYPNNITIFVNLLTIANFIGNEYLYNACLQKLYEILKKALQERRWNIFLKMPDLLKAFDLQADLKNTIVESPTIINLFQHLNREKKIGKSGLYSLGLWDDKEWLVLKASSKRKQESATSTVFLKTLPNDAVIAELEVPFNKEQIVNPFFFSPLQKILYAIGDKKIALYKAETGELITEIEAPSSVFSISFDGNNTLLAAAVQGKIIVYDLATKEVKKEFDIELGSKIALSANGNLIAIQKNSKTVEIWDFIKQEPIAHINLENGELVLLLQFLNDNNSLIIVSSLGEIRIFNPKAKGIKSFKRRGDFSNVTLATTSNDRLLAIAFKNRAARIRGRKRTIIPGIDVLDLQSNSLIKSIKTKSEIRSLNFSSDNYKLVFMNAAGLYQINLFPKKIKNLNLHEILLFWYLIEQAKNNQPFQIPEGYNEVFEQLPKKIKKYLRMGRPGAASEEPEKETTQRKEKRKEPEKEEEQSKEKKKNIHKRFKWD
jgi:hypothetical protein